MIFALIKTAYIRIFNNIDKESKDKVIRSLNSKVIYNGRKQIDAMVLSSYSTYPLDWIKLKDLYISYEKKYSFRDTI